MIEEYFKMDKNNILNISLFIVPLVQMADRIIKILAEHSMKNVVDKISEIDLPIPEHNPSGKEVLLWEPKNHSGATAFASNLVDGWYTMVNILSVNNDCKTIFIRYSPIGKTDYPICELMTYENSKFRRIIRSMKDEPRWEFFEKGHPYDFENQQNYKKRRIKDRFTINVLVEYVHKLGWDIEDKDFLLSNKEGILIKHI